MSQSMDQLQQSIALQQVLEHKVNRIFYNEELTLKLARAFKENGTAARKLQTIEELVKIIENCIVNEQYRRALHLLVALDKVGKELIENL
jgi:SPX domain protein involved in polyphosphate accumulation